MNILAPLMLTVGLVAGSPTPVEVPPSERDSTVYMYQSIKDWLGCSDGQKHPWCSK